MPSYCCVHETHEASKSLFGVPKNAEIKILWEEALGMQLKKSHRVCAKHFYKSDIVSTWDSGQDSSKYTVNIFFINNVKFLYNLSFLHFVRCV